MSAWVLVPSLVALRREFDAVSPGRDRGADGSIGDSAHTSSSDHTPDEDSDVLRDHDADAKNEVHALDIDSSGPWPGASWFDSMIKSIVDRERARWLSADDVCRLEYVIWNRKIYSRVYDFRERAYTKDDPHTNHAHFSSRYLTTSENDTRPWGVVGDEDDVDDATIDKIADRVVSKMTAAMVNGTKLEERTGASVLNYAGGGLPDDPDMPANSNFLNHFTKTADRVREILDRVPDQTPAQRVDK